MASWSAESIIDTVFIPLYAVLLFANIFNVIKHGITYREAGYVYLLLVSVLKISGNIMTVVVNTSNSTNIELITWGIILSQLGFYPLLSASLAFMNKWLRTWENVDPGLQRFHRPQHLLHLVILGGFTCSIIGGVWSSPDDANINTGYTLRRVGSIIFIVATIFVFFLAATAKKSASGSHGNDMVLRQLFIVLPIMFVRIVYATVQSFKSTPQSPGHNTWVYLALLIIPDFLATAIYTYFGAVVLRRFERVAEQSPREGYKLGPGQSPQQPAYQEPY